MLDVFVIVVSFVNYGADHCHLLVECLCRLAPPPSLPPQQVTAAPALNQPGSWGHGSQASCFLHSGCLNVDYCWAGLDGSNLAPHWSLTVTVRLFTLLWFGLFGFVFWGGFLTLEIKVETIGSPGDPECVCTAAALL